MSSAEAELYSCVSAVSGRLGGLSILKGFRRQCSGLILWDASAALGVINKQGLGRMSHLDTGFCGSIRPRRRKPFNSTTRPAPRTPLTC